MTDDSILTDEFPSPGLHGLSDKTAIVTGSTRGIGRRIAKRFAAEGVNTIVTGRTVDAGETVAEEIRDAGYEATFVRADMVSVDEIEELVETTVDTYGSVDVIVNNAAAWQHTAAEDGSVEDWEFVMDVSLRAPWLLSMLALEHMPPGGSILNVSSVHSERTDPARFPYNVAKAGLNGLTRALAVDFGEYGVCVNGLVVGNIIKQYHGESAFDEDNWEARLMPVHRRGTPGDVAGLAVFLASEEARFITGANIPVDGGRLTSLATENWPPDETTEEDALHTYPDRIPDSS